MATRATPDGGSVKDIDSNIEGRVIPEDSFRTVSLSKKKGAAVLGSGGGSGLNSPT